MAITITPQYFNRILDKFIMYTKKLVIYWNMRLLLSVRNTPDGLEFVRVAGEESLKEAVARRDGPFGD